jgi:predicted TIM-barrel fold metal-dependent hydrolase
MIFDTDAHVEESRETFAALEAREEFAQSAPRVIEGHKRGLWLIEGKTFPKLTGKGVNTFGSPHLHRGAGLIDPERRARVESQELSDPAARLADMDQEGIYASVVFPTIFLVYPLAEDQNLLRAMCWSYNEWIARKSGETSGRIRWVAAVPLPDIEGAVEELNHAKKLGTSGVLVLGTAGEMLLDDPRLDPFYQGAQKLNLPVCVHVGWSFPPLTGLYSNVYASLATPFVLPIFMAFTSILCGGVLDRYPELRVGFFEAGVEWVPYWLDRLERFYKQPPGGSQKKDLPICNPREYVEAGRVYFSCELDEKRISETAKVIGDGSILYASDLPHAHRVFDAIKIFRARRDIAENTKTKILEENGHRFFWSLSQAPSR